MFLGPCGCGEGTGASRFYAGGGRASSAQNRAAANSSGVDGFPDFVPCNQSGGVFYFNPLFCFAHFFVYGLVGVEGE